MSESLSSQEQEPTSIEVANKLRTLGEEQGFDKETCDEIAELPFEEAFEAAYGYLLQAGLDPEDVLADFMEDSD